MDTTLLLIGEEIGKLHLPSIIKAVIYLGVGYIFARLTGFTMMRWMKEIVSIHNSKLLSRISFYLVFGLFGVSAMWELGFNLQVLLGAAGIFTVALGFASQTSASNLISGIFLLSERPFQVDDTIKVGDTVGEVISIDLLSVKLRTFDNLFVRIPNEALIKAEITTLTKFPIRRLDIYLGVAYKENLENVRDILFEIADKNTNCLDNPKPLFFIKEFGTSSVDIQFSAWAKQEGLFKTRTNMMMEIKKVFEQKGIEIPFPHITLHSGAHPTPVPISIVEGAPAPSDQSEKPKE
ncbi:MAG: mechanosensitive ion channel family protein [Nitrospinota bacterium]|nr:mechanosensitive ion channel family protein [Nitrospinota bacterium]